eukprot:3427829-Lingulodinium_polyedra.AAC.1
MPPPPALPAGLGGYGGRPPPPTLAQDTGAQGSAGSSGQAACGAGLTGPQACAWDPWHDPETDT